jgi:glycosyltransferase involved in cell wall biosynthesis
MRDRSGGLRNGSSTWGNTSLTQFRLVIYTDFSYRIRQGSITAELPFVLFINALVANGLHVTVAGRVDTDDEPYPFELDRNINFIGLPGYRSLANPFSVARATFRTLRHFADNTSTADGVWLFGPHPFALGFAAIARLRGQPVVLGVRQDLPALISRRRPNQRWIRWAALLLEGAYRALSRRCATVVVGPSLAYSYRAARRLLNLPISLVAESQIVDPATAMRRSYDHELTAISVGRLDPEKNPLLLADVLQALRSKDSRWNLKVYGDGSLAGALTDRLQQLDLTEHAKLCGYLPVDQGLIAAYRSSHALLHVSWTEGVPQVLFEAFAAGLPVVATDVGGVAEAVGEAAILVPPGEAAAPAHALDAIGRDAAKREALISAGLEKVAGLTLEQQARRAAAFVTENSSP